MNFLPRTPTQFLWTMKYLLEKCQLVTHLQDLFDIDVNTVVHTEVVENLGQWVDVQRREIPESVKSANARFLKKVVSISGH